MAPIPLPDLSRIWNPPASIPAIQIPDLPSYLKRQTTVVAIPVVYGNINDGPAPGTVVGITLGAVGGFLLLLWLLYTCFGGGGGFGNYGYTASDNVSSIVVRERKSRSGRSRRSGSRRVSETAEMRRERVVPVVVAERVVVDRARSVASAPADDEVVVIEEHSPEPVRRERSKRESGYRTVDPMAYAGGNRPLRDVRRSGRRG